MLVVGVDLLAELVDELVEAEVDLGLDLVVEVLLAEHGEGVVRAVVVQVEGVQDAPGKHEGNYGKGKEEYMFITTHRFHFRGKKVHWMSHTTYTQRRCLFTTYILHFLRNFMTERDTK